MTARTSQPAKRFQFSARPSLALLLILGMGVTISSCGKKNEVPEFHEPASSAAPSPVPPPEEPVAAQAPLDEEPAEEISNEPPPPHPGPWFWVTQSSVGIYTEPRAKRELKIGYAQRGGKVPILEGKVEGEHCSTGWYRTVHGYYICSKVGTTDENHKDVKFAPRRPNLDEILPYPYARNAHNGTPLYKSLPSKSQMLEYEPYLVKDKKKEDKPTEAKPSTAQAKTDDASKDEGATAAAPAHTPDEATTSATALAAHHPDAEGAAAEEISEEPATPWWQQDDIKDRLHEITLDKLSEEADGILAMRMVRGFYIAVDSTFNWNGRRWYKTTQGLLAPVDRFWQAKGSEFKGVEIDGETWKLPVAWVYGARKQGTTYVIDETTKQVQTKGSVKKFVAIQLTGKQIEIGKKTYYETADGTWMRGDHIRRTSPEPRPADVGPNERWIDINLTEQTLIAFEGDRPVYATLVSGGKESTIKAKDHRTPRGSWRVREKHVTAKMDGDGSAAGDLPYSIQDVPYVMYYQGSYAIHGAFWHENYGVRMSHGCVNLAPLDAKHIFFWADPQIPEGWHGMWSNDTVKGSLIVAHD